MHYIIVIALLVCSNLLMTFAWYWHLKGNINFPIWQIILISWAIALLEYCLVVPANHFGSSWGIKPFELKIIQEVLSLIVFTVFAIVYLKAGFKLNYLFSFLCILGAVYFAFKK
ncbi:MAG: DMT family protein [Neisseriaceae bacterium]|nr:DMT family protein [Neisseriaceae bacterium]